MNAPGSRSAVKLRDGKQWRGPTPRSIRTKAGNGAHRAASSLRSGRPEAVGAAARRRDVFVEPSGVNSFGDLVVSTRRARPIAGRSGLAGDMRSARAAEANDIPLNGALRRRDDRRTGRLRQGNAQPVRDECRRTRGHLLEPATRRSPSSPPGTRARRKLHRHRLHADPTNIGTDRTFAHPVSEMFDPATKRPLRRQFPGKSCARAKAPGRSRSPA